MIIRSGGQTGVDRAALEVAIELGLPACGWCPRGGWAEDSPNPPGVLDLYPFLTETPAADPQQRSAWNVRDSDATLLVVEGDIDASPGTRFTLTCAELVFLKPSLVVKLRDDDAETRAKAWLRHVQSSSPFVLNVAGPRESEDPGVFERARNFLRRLLAV